MRLKPQEGGRFDESGLEYPECHKCVHDGKKSKACLKCRAKGTMLGVVRRGPAGYEGTEFLEDRQSRSATSLPPDVEDRFRTALCELFQLRPLELLVLQGIMQRKTLTEIAASLTQTFKKYGGKGFTRFYVKEVRKAMATKMP